MSTREHGRNVPGHELPHDRVVVIKDAGDHLLAEARQSSTGRSANTLVAVPGLRSTLIALTTGTELSEHDSPGAATLLCLQGRVRLVSAEGERTVAETGFVAIPEHRHSLAADEDSIVLLTVRLDAPGA